MDGDDGGGFDLPGGAGLCQLPPRAVPRRPAPARRSLPLSRKFDPSRPGAVVARAVILGAVAGLLAALFLTVTAEPSIEDAIRIEHNRAVAAGTAAAHDDGPVSRGTQKGVGLFSAYAVSGAAFGLLFAAGFVIMKRGQPDPFRRALVSGTVLAGSLTVSPWFKYPPNPPAVGDPGTLARRQFLYASVIVLTVAILAGAAYLSRRLRDADWPDAWRVAAVVAAVAVPVAVVYAALPPAPDAVTVPATLVWRFRLASLGGNLLLWTVLAVGFGVLASEAGRRTRVAAG